MRRIFKSRRLNAYPVASHLIVIAVSAALQTALPVDAADHQTYTMPFSYDSRGIGSNPLNRELLVPPALLTPTISEVLLHSLQDLQFSIPEKNRVASQPLDPKKEYLTDIVPLSEATIAAHNAANPGLSVGTDVHYALQYRIVFNIDDDPHGRKIIIELRPILYYRGDASTKWREYKKQYSGDYLISGLTQALDRNFAAVGGKP